MTTFWARSPIIQALSTTGRASLVTLYTFICFARCGSHAASSVVMSLPSSRAATELGEVLVSGDVRVRLSDGCSLESGQDQDRVRVKFPSRAQGRTAGGRRLRVVLLQQIALAARRHRRCSQRLPRHGGGQQQASCQAARQRPSCRLLVRRRPAAGRRAAQRRQ